MVAVITLIRPRFLSFRNKGWGKKQVGRLVFFCGIGLLFWACIYGVSYRVLVYFIQIEELGHLLVNKLLSMILITFSSLLVFSAVLTSLSKLYLSKDLSLVHAMPVSGETVFISRWIESLVDSSWMVIVYALPIFMAYGNVYSAGIFFYTHMALVLIPLCIIISALSTVFVLIAVLILPANRMKSIVVFLGLMILIVLYMAFRLLKPERLVNPETFTSTILYLNSINTPSSPLLPSTWALDSLTCALSGNMKAAWFHIALLWSGAVFMALITFLFANAFYFKGFSKTQSAQVKLFKTSGKGLSTVFRFIPGPIRALLIKEIKSFWRDQAQWSQLFLIGALIAIYIYNFSVLPLDKAPIQSFYLQNLLSFLNMGLAAFVLTAVVARFAFPTVSAEGNAFWIVQSGPISIKAFLWIKFIIYLIPLFLLSQLLIVFSNVLLKVTPFIMALSIVTLFCITPGVIALGIGLGAAYPDFHSENPAQAVTSFGGLMFMILSTFYVGLVIGLEAGPVYTIFMSSIRGKDLSLTQVIWIIASFGTAFLISILFVLLPMRFGIKRLMILSCLTDRQMLA